MRFAPAVSSSATRALCVFPAFFATVKGRPRTRVTSIDWSSYPILRFASVPDEIEVHVVNRPGEAFLGTGEAAQGPTPAAIGNAIRYTPGVRMRILDAPRWAYVAVASPSAEPTP